MPIGNVSLEIKGDYSKKKREKSLHIVCSIYISNNEMNSVNTCNFYKLKS